MFGVHEVKVHIFVIPKYLKYFWDPKMFTTFWDPNNVHFYLMYLKQGSMTGLIMTL